MIFQSNYLFIYLAIYDDTKAYHKIDTIIFYAYNSLISKYRTNTHIVLLKKGEHTFCFPQSPIFHRLKAKTCRPVVCKGKRGQEAGKVERDEKRGPWKTTDAWEGDWRSGK